MVFDGLHLQSTMGKSKILTPNPQTNNVNDHFEQSSNESIKYIRMKIYVVIKLGLRWQSKGLNTLQHPTPNPSLA